MVSVNELDPTKVYFLNRKTGEVRVHDTAVMAEEGFPVAGAAGIDDVGLFDAFTEFDGRGDTVNGLARSVVTCPFGGQTAAVRGVQASQVSRDPSFGLPDKEGIITVDNVLTTVAEVTFITNKATGGARNPSNFTRMVTTHTGKCGDEFMVREVVSTWPRRHASLIIDDTGSMSEELGGVRTALANFIQNEEANAETTNREISYELITFKDTPTLRLANTQNTASALAAVNSLSASGGGDCPEESLGAVMQGLDGIQSDEDAAGEMILVTDASPQSGDIDGIISRAQSLGVRVNVLLSGDCVASASALSSSTAASSLVASSTLSSRDVFSRIADETGGIFVFEPGLQEEGYARILEDIFAETLAGGSDTEPPVVDVTVTPDLLWPPDHRMVEVFPSVSVTDNIDTNPVIELISVTSSEENNTQGDGNTDDDIIVEDNGRIFVRAERSGSGEMRVYTITFKATDESGNEGFGTADILVPHNR